MRRASVVSVPSKSFSFLLPHHRRDRYSKGLIVVVLAKNSSPDFNFALVLELYVDRRDKLFPTPTLLIFQSRGESLSHSWVLPLLKLVAPGITDHGLRAGGATFLAEHRVPADIIKRMER